MHGLLLARVRDLRNWWHDPIAWVSDAAVIAISDRKKCSVRIHFADTFPWSWLFGDLHILIEMNPTATTWTFFTECFCRHEIVRSLNANTHILAIRALRQIERSIEFVTFFVLFSVEFPNAARMHVLR